MPKLLVITFLIILVIFNSTDDKSESTLKGEQITTTQIANEPLNYSYELSENIQLSFNKESLIELNDNLYRAGVLFNLTDYITFNASVEHRNGLSLGYSFSIDMLGGLWQVKLSNIPNALRLLTY
jgi:hypothetical protein